MELSAIKSCFFRSLFMVTLSDIPGTFRRWLVFNFVGLMGIVVQMAILRTLTSGFNLHYLPATGLAVEAAVLHNFVWHERWTWSDRIAVHSCGFFPRLLRFHLTNGALSIAGNLILMRFFVGSLGLHYLHANAIAIALCSILNFMAGDRIVFRVVGLPHQKGVTAMTKKSSRILVCLLFMPPAVLLLGALRATAADLQSKTLKAWGEYVQLTERRISAELSSQKGFLSLDFQDASKAEHERQAMLKGEILIKRMATGADGRRSIPVPDGMIHHWKGSVFIPGVTLDFVLSRVNNPGLEDTRQEDVLDSRILESAPGQLKLFLKLQRSKIVTVVYNTEHLVRYQRHGNGQASSSSIATKISELERLQGNAEREKPEGCDRGFLWRMNSYWRYQQVPGGVIVECESMTLSRSIPSLLEYMIRPIINSVARESMHRTLQSMRTRMVRSYQPNPGIS
jgi:putative flippase GtrA